MEHRPLILFAGRLVSQKNALVMTDAIIDVLERLDGRAIICGDGPEAPAVRRLVQKRRMTDRIDIIGYRSDLWSIMKSAAVFVSVSLYEGHPNTVLEAMACRCPLVVSDIPAHRVFLDERSAWLPSPQSRQQIAHAILAALGEPSVAAQKAETAWNVVKRYTPVNCAELYRQVYRVIVGS
jgi:starch synthase (maltosyl-transferring)